MSFIKPNNIISSINSGKRALNIVNRSIGVTINNQSSFSGGNKYFPSANFNDAAINNSDNNPDVFICGTVNFPWGSHKFTVGS